MFLSNWWARKQISLHRDNKVVLFCSFKKGHTLEVCVLCFVIINSVLFNPLRVWIFTTDASWELSQYRLMVSLAQINNKHCLLHRSIQQLWQQPAFLLTMHCSCWLTDHIMHILWKLPFSEGGSQCCLYRLQNTYSSQYGKLQCQLAHKSNKKNKKRQINHHIT